MDNILTYIKYRGDIPFSRMPLNEADMVAFSMISYLDFSSLVDDVPLLSEAAQRYKKLHAAAQSDGTVAVMREETLYRMAECRRYEKVRLASYVRDINEQEEKTFYALTIWVSRWHGVVAFPGTDHTLLSWKENFVYMYEHDAPGLVASANYLVEALRKRFTKIDVIGHSKGGYQAVYASVKAPQRLQRRIHRLYLFDSPGFVYPIEETQEYKLLESRMLSYVPEDCAIGNLNRPNYGQRIIIRSNGEGFAQHECDNWEITASGIARGDGYSPFSDRLSKIVNDLVEAIEPENRKAVIDEMFGVLFSNGIMRIDDVNNLKLRNGIKLLMSYPKLSPQTKTLMKTLLREMKNG